MPPPSSPPSGAESAPEAPSSRDDGAGVNQPKDKLDDLSTESALDAKSTTDGPDTAEPSSDDAPPLPSESVPSVPPLPNEDVPSGPPLPQEPPPQAEDDGWDFQWDPNSQSYFFYNRFTGKTQWENPRLASNSAPAGAPGTEASNPKPPASEKPPVSGYNPAIHGDYDPNAWYAQGDDAGEADGGEASATGAGLGGQADLYSATAQFNRFTGQFQSEDMGPGRHTDEAKSRRQMNAFFDVDAAANSHDGRSLKAERSNKKPSKSELKAFKEKRRAKKEEKRRAWLRD